MAWVLEKFKRRDVVKPEKGKNTIVAWNGNVISRKGLNRKNLPYIFIWIIYYAWVVAFSTWWTASPLKEHVFNIELRNIMHSVNLISSAVFIIFMQKEWFVKTVRIGAVLVISGMALFIAVPAAPLRTVFAVIIGISMGCVNISILMPFVFILNNTEKLYAAVGANALIQIISFIMEAQPDKGLLKDNDMWISLAILVTGLASVLFFKKDRIKPDRTEQEKDPPAIHGRIYLTLLFNCIIAVFCRGAGKGVLNIAALHTDIPVSMWFYNGGLLGCAIYFIVYAFVPKAYIWLGNITFFCVAMGLLCNAFSMQAPGLIILFALLLGIGSTVGMINMYYIIGVIGKKYNSMRYLRLSILCVGICGGAVGIAVGNLIGSADTFHVSMVASIVAIFFMMLFMMISPIMAQGQYEDDWGRDSQNTEIDRETSCMFQQYRMSKRETEVCKLLLKGYTLRQISGILAISYSTVNTYCTSAYRKLGINSRTELLLHFKDYIK